MNWMDLLKYLFCLLLFHTSYSFLSCIHILRLKINFSGFTIIQESCIYISKFVFNITSYFVLIKNWKILSNVKCISRSYVHLPIRVSFLLNYHKIKFSDVNL